MQFAGILLVLLAMLAAELASLALELRPGSPLLWWLNLELFRSLNAASGSMMVHVTFDYRLTIPALLAVLALSVVAFRVRHRLALSMLSNLAFIWCGLAAYLWYFSRTAISTASLSDTLNSNFSGWLLLAYIGTASLVGFLVTHILYWRAGWRWAVGQAGRFRSRSS